MHISSPCRLCHVHHKLNDSQVSTLASSAHGFVGADIAHLVDEAALSALRRVVVQGSGSDAHNSSEASKLV